MQLPQLLPSLTRLVSFVAAVCCSVCVGSNIITVFGPGTTNVGAADYKTGVVPFSKIVVIVGFCINSIFVLEAGGTRLDFV